VKFLGIASMKESFLMLPPAVTGQLFEASIAAINQQKKAGKIKELYYIPVWDRAVAISEAATAEEAYKKLLGDADRLVHDGGVLSPGRWH
jgi:hypothetical protein